MTKQSVDELRSLLEADLRSAMSAKASREVGVLRTLLAEIDNAQAVPVGTLHQRYSVKMFGDGSAEVSRKSITFAELQVRLCADRDERLATANLCEASGRTEQADILRQEARIVERYIAAK